MIIRPIEQDDLTRGLLETLEALSPYPFDIDMVKARLIVAERVLDENRLTMPRLLTFVAVEQERVIGTSSLLLVPHLIHGGSHSGEIENVAVHRDHQRKGVGKSLVEHAVAVARKMKCYKVILGCSAENVPFYSKIGFYQHGYQMRMDLEVQRQEDVCRR